MAPSIKSSLALALMFAVALSTAACSPRKIAPTSISDFMEDKVALDGVILKCNQDADRARGDADCLNARVAIERLASQNDTAREAKRAEEFERRREELRSLQDRQRQEQEGNAKIDAYHLPLVPVEQSPAPRDAQSPMIGQALR